MYSTYMDNLSLYGCEKACTVLRCKNKIKKETNIRIKILPGDPSYVAILMREERARPPVTDIVLTVPDLIKSLLTIRDGG
jgi:hypothetical protein